MYSDRYENILLLVKIFTWLARGCLSRRELGEFFGYLTQKQYHPTHTLSQFVIAHHDHHLRAPALLIQYNRTHQEIDFHFIGQ